jgi:HAD superfamily hydrolase (TIGR01509 family)
VAISKPIIQAVVFDMDGLMFNTEDLYDEVGEIMLQRRGLSFTLELKLEMMGLPGDKAFEVLKSRTGLTESVAQLRKETTEIFQDMIPSRIEMMPGLESLLHRLEQTNVPKAVATSSHRQFATRALGAFDLEPRFEFVLTGDDVENGKPHPDVYLMATKRLQTSPAQTLVLEDSHVGSRAAVAAGAFVVAVPTKHSQALDFSHVNAVAKGLDDPLIANLLEEFG